ncbi:F-box protein CPR30 [Spatholobus suberectus]|nr:F-box protein CPR30 [Spatholobus suberectus]
MSTMLIVTREGVKLAGNRAVMLLDSSYFLNIFTYFVPINRTKYCAGDYAYASDYKLIRISYFVDLHDRSFDSQVKLYTLCANAWRTLPSMPYALCCACTMGVFVGKCLHWVVTHKFEPDQPDLIIAFDLNRKSFREVPLPEVEGEGFEIDVALLVQPFLPAKRVGPLARAHFNSSTQHDREFSKQEDLCVGDGGVRTQG